MYLTVCKLSDLYTQSFGRGMLYRTVDNVHLFLSEHLVHVPVDDTVAVTRGPALRVNEFVNKCHLQKIVRLSNKFNCYRN